MRSILFKHCYVIIIVLVIILFFLWVFFGGKDHEFAGIGCPSKCSINEPSNACTIEETCTIEEPIKKKIKRSKGETECVRVLEKLFDREFKRVRPPFLKSPETGRNLELDCYNEELKLAIEYNGRQHYKYPSFPGFTEDQFKAQLQRDQFKRERCNELGIFLITVPYHIGISDIEEYIVRLLPYTLRGLANL
uniref:Restriction endonuclease n=1 Tax=Pithovirus LCPAC401 TaxID=2506595 RepID=A0A481ZA53_9VIRU|nr:MAG: restriction endonuclease [Pithovirus LCPAC401]